MPEKLSKKEALQVQTPPTVAEDLRRLEIGEAMRYLKSEWNLASRPSQYVHSVLKDMTFDIITDEESYTIKRLT